MAARNMRFFFSFHVGAKLAKKGLGMMMPYVFLIPLTSALPIFQ